MPSAARLATLTIVLSAARTIQATWWSALPSATVPGSEPVIVLFAILIAAICLAVLHVSRKHAGT